MDPIAPLIAFANTHRRLLVLTGAGCSTAAGIPDYRDADGQWKRSEPMRFQLFVADAHARKRYWARSMIGWRTMSKARPALAHHALARLQSADRVSLLVTQNVDGLHSAAGTRQVIDLHGRIDTVCCLQCAQRTPRAELQASLLRANPDWAALQADTAPDGDADLEDRDFAQFDVPPCSACGGVLKPDVVFFGENVPRHVVEAAWGMFDEADALVVLGSSLTVFSGYRFVLRASERGVPVAIVNRGVTRGDPHAALKLDAGVAEALGAS